MKIVLIGNYKKDRQMSMLLYAQMLEREYALAGHSVVLWNPICLFGNLFKDTTKSVGKWFSYMDKWILFPLVILMRRLHPKNNGKDVYFQICDHSNAVYLPYLNKKNTVVTCHDVLAIRGAFGHKDAYCEASSTGLILQKWILRNLLKAEKLASVSETTLNQIKEFAELENREIKNWKVILCPFNGNFYQIEESEKAVFLEKQKLNGKPFILHVGSSLPRKNRKMLVSMLDKLRDSWEGVVCYAGEKIDSELQEYIDSKNLNNRVHSVVFPDHKDLVALYNTCEAFIFPSYSEGFGMPLVEAQSCAAVVIASNLLPMPEISGGAALHEHPDDSEGFSKAFLKLKNDPQLKRELISKGLENIHRFDVKEKVKQYLAFIKE